MGREEGDGIQKASALVSASGVHGTDGVCVLGVGGIYNSKQTELRSLKCQGLG